MKANNESKQERKARPAVQIYRPPGLRALGNSNALAGQPKNETPKPITTINAINAINTNKSLNRKGSDQLSNTSSGSQGSTKKVEKPKPKEPTNRLPAKKAVNSEEIIVLVQKLALSNEQAMIGDFVEAMEKPEVASRLGHFISRFSIEENRHNQRVCSNIALLLLDCPAGSAFYNGLVASLTQYYECADKLRSTHFRVWLNYLSFLNDLYLNVGFRYDGEIADLIFKIFNYILKLDMKIEELESLIAMFLNIGCELGRDFPYELSELKNNLRDTLLSAHEAWSRKMLLLLVELSASNFNLSQEANEFYFH
ncbi:hypothetical protein M3Y97_00061600 [Aphelenchoides bicaudatus]|nr:hypothetical protein M3Y97_00061600 [Aphelenchoides bicaudatus]